LVAGGDDTQADDDDSGEHNTNPRNRTEAGPPPRTKELP
jgi:hypothetical protein